MADVLCEAGVVASGHLVVVVGDLNVEPVHVPCHTSQASRTSQQRA